MTPNDEIRQGQVLCAATVTGVIINDKLLRSAKPRYTKRVIVRGGMQVNLLRTDLPNQSRSPR